MDALQDASYASATASGYAAPDAECIGALRSLQEGPYVSVNFRLDFYRYSKRWHGASATIVETEHSVVWGIIWELDKCNLATLDCQEGVQDNIYHAMSVNVETPGGRTLNCRVYQQCNNPKEYIKPEDFPMDKRPSPLYLNTILKGAKENKLPTDYIKFLKTIPDNGYEGDYDIR
ncbi:Gamma-glutamylcyclotransferase [Atta colombica]|uniref:gamma-glutamylcyclotransferase n=1 Tax=Atta colombica TaxID=520822 RepID=A0A195AX88_9HYME|nr:Gamma-glutamylcyclotransferase [Atta colombica]